MNYTQDNNIVVFHNEAQWPRELKKKFEELLKIYRVIIFPGNEYYVGRLPWPWEHEFLTRADELIEDYKIKHGLNT